jgi:predicted regulator of Ras-like GTPase activity (Roadblock/LC7/MglB family)
VLNPQLSSLIVTTEGLKNITNILNKLREDTKARYIILVEKSGQMIANVGEETPFTMPLSALVAGAFASTREIAKLVGETEFNVMYQQGKNRNIYIFALKTQDLLTVVFDESPSLGIVKIKTKEVSEALSNEILSMLHKK